MATPLTLLMPVVSGTSVGTLATLIQQNLPAIDQALTNIGTVHYARFLVLDTTTANLQPTGPTDTNNLVLAVITEYDGSFSGYISDFVKQLGNVFDALLQYVQGGSAVIPVQNNLAAFTAFIAKNDYSQMPGVPAMYQAYPYTVQQILAWGQRTPALLPLPLARGIVEAASQLGFPPEETYMDESSIDYADVQGTILRGYRVDLGRHFILQIINAVAAQKLIGSMVGGSSGVPQITTAARWTSKPDCFINIGFTCVGLSTLGLTADQLQTFDSSFQLGATNPTTANNIGDIGESAPENWIGGLSDANAVHVVLSLWVTKDPAILEQVSSELRGLFNGAFKELSAHDGRALKDNKVHFGYRDSIAQPTIVGVPARKHEIPDDQPAVATGEFLLGYLNEIGGTYSVQPPGLSRNSSYSSFRILEQDVEGFEEFLQVYAKQAGIDPEMLAAKVCGRWRNGNPLELTPEDPGKPLPLSELNDFQYVPNGNAQDNGVYDDTLGLRCPIGSHIRRNNPRNEAVVGGGSSVNHRIIRRAMPYGPDDETKADAPRGLIGHFINGSIANQFEFLLSQWNQTSQFVKSVSGTNCTGNPVLNISGEDVFLGINDASTGSFTLSACVNGRVTNTTLTGFERLITTRGGAYLFLPSITGLKYLATLGALST